MIKNIVEKLILASAFLFSSIQVTSAEHLSKGKILEIRADEGGRIEIVRESPTHPEECSNAKDFYFFSDEETLPMLAIILTAYQSGRDITFKTNSCGGEGYINRIYGVVLE